MSAGSAIPLPQAFAGMRQLREAMLMGADAQEARAVQQLVAVGSVRRRVPAVHDVELLAPLPSDGTLGEAATWADDPLARLLARMCGTPADDLLASVSLFQACPTPPEWKRTPALLKADRGLKPNFAACYLSFATGPIAGVKLQVFRCSHQGAGWATIMRTGPREFGIHFLVQWKRKYGISKEQDASSGGMLVDAGGRAVALATEHEAFAACGLEYVEPHHRDEYIRRLDRQERTERQWQTR